MVDATLGASPLSLLKRKGFKNMATIKAAFRGWEERVDLDERSAVPGRFVLQLADELTPTNIMDRLGQAVILDHVFDLQTLHAYDLVLAYDLCRELVLVVSSSIGNLLWMRATFNRALAWF